MLDLPDGPPLDQAAYGLAPGQALEAKVMRAVAALPPGDDALEGAARRMLASSEPAERLEGAAILAAVGLLTSADLEGFAQEEELPVPLTLLGWLNDGGYLDLRDQLLLRLGEAGRDPEALRRELRSPEIGPSARRALLEHLSPELDPDAAQALFRSLATHSGLEYEVRLLAATHLAGTREPGSNLQLLRALQSDAASGIEVPPGSEDEPPDSTAVSLEADPAWERGLARLIERNQVPPGLYPGTPPVTVFAIQADLATAHPTTLTDLATYLGYALTREDLMVQTGATGELEDRLVQYEEDAPNLPVAEQASLRRLRGYLERLHAIEQVTGSQVVVDAPPF